MMEAWIISVEGPDYLNKGLWSTHAILGIFPNEKEARAWVGSNDAEDENVVLITHIRNQEIIMQERID